MAVPVNVCVNGGVGVIVNVNVNVNVNVDVEVDEERALGSASGQARPPSPVSPNSVYGIRRLTSPC